MSDQVEGAVADAGQAVQRRINQAGEATEQLTQFVREQPIPAVLIFLGIGYILAKIF
jgi:ElaB/YqjD/DUF883 family membrane-anchored ribosome-binding protein